MTFSKKFQVLLLPLCGVLPISMTAQADDRVNHVGKVVLQGFEGHDYKATVSPAGANGVVALVNGNGFSATVNRSCTSGDCLEAVMEIDVVHANGVNKEPGVFLAKLMKASAACPAGQSCMSTGTAQVAVEGLEKHVTMRGWYAGEYVTGSGDRVVHDATGTQVCSRETGECKTTMAILSKRAKPRWLR